MPTGSSSSSERRPAPTGSPIRSSAIAGGAAHRHPTWSTLMTTLAARRRRPLYLEDGVRGIVAAAAAPPAVLGGGFGSPSSSSTSCSRRQNARGAPNSPARHLLTVIRRARLVGCRARMIVGQLVSVSSFSGSRGPWLRILGRPRGQQEHSFGADDDAPGLRRRHDHHDHGTSDAGVPVLVTTNNADNARERRGWRGGPDGRPGARSLRREL